MAERKTSTPSNGYLRTGQPGIPVPGAGRTDGRLRQGDPMIPQKRRP
ncbi:MULTISPECIES: hypothetical protein [Streptomyces]|uniref:Uncharacterized protein n=1 Tax=Streptomyces tamarix TaxID=3078565 RepID=A0ABU3QS37_9ACTN|nr:hypothetical protein [Streptomyces tamarix]MDT9685580.1 hypothetical protein [Streptomyces tamarix]